MGNIKNIKEEIVKDENFWENELLYFENALDGLKTAFAIVDAMRIQAQNNLNSVKEKEE